MSGDDLIPVEYISVGGLVTGAITAQGWRGRPTAADYFHLREILQQVFDRLGSATHPQAAFGANRALPAVPPGKIRDDKPGRRKSGRRDRKLHPGIASKIDLRHRIYLFELNLDPLIQAPSASPPHYRTISRQQAILRDVAPRVAESVSYAAVCAAIRAAEAPYLHEYRLTNLFRGAPLAEGVKSLTIALTFAYNPRTTSDDRAVTEQEVNDALQRIKTELSSRCGAEFPALGGT